MKMRPVRARLAIVATTRSGLSVAMLSARSWPGHSPGKLRSQAEKRVALIQRHRTQWLKIEAIRDGAFSNAAYKPNDMEAERRMRPSASSMRTGCSQCSRPPRMR
jgi:hypothetical protein